MQGSVWDSSGIHRAMRTKPGQRRWYKASVHLRQDRMVESGHRVDAAQWTFATPGELLGAKRRQEQTVDA